MANTGCVNCEESRLENRTVAVRVCVLEKLPWGGGEPWTKMPSTKSSAEGHALSVSVCLLIVNMGS